MCASICHTVEPDEVRTTTFVAATEPWKYSPLKCCGKMFHLQESLYMRALLLPEALSTSGAGQGCEDRVSTVPVPKDCVQFVASSGRLP